MDHKQAVELQLAVKYVLGELPAAQRDEYEDHYIDCPDCAKEVHAAAAFVDNARHVLRQEARNEVAKGAAEGGWFRWLRPVVAVPALAALLFAISYQSFVTVPRWKEMATRSAASRALPMFSLIAANSRDSKSLTISVRSGEPFGLYVDVPVNPAYGTYLLRLEDPSGQSTVLISVSYAEAQRTQVVEVNPGNHPGIYQIAVLGLTDENSDPSKATVLRTMKFSVEFNR